ncbi:unnamed protein product, partial [Vitis vinifera]
MNYYQDKPPVVGAPPPSGYPTAYPVVGPPAPPQTVYVNQPPAESIPAGCCGCLAGCLAGICCCCTLEICF